MAQELYQRGLRVPVLQAPTVQRVDVSSGALAAADAGYATEDMIERKEREDAAVWAGMNSAKARSEWAQRIREAREKGEVNDGFKGQIETEFKTYQNETIAAAPRYAKDAMRLHLANIGADIGNAALDAESDMRITRRTGQAEEMLNHWGNIIATDPSQFKKGWEQSGAVLGGLQLPTDVKQKLEIARRGLASQAISKMSETDPGRVIRELDAGQWNEYVDADARRGLYNAAQSEQKRRVSEARAQAVAQSSAGAAMLAVRINRFANGQADDIGQDEIDKMRGSLTPSSWATLQKQYDDARAKRAKDDEDRVDVAARIEAGVGIDPGNPKQKKAYDAYFRKSVVPAIEAQASAAPDPAGTASAMVLDFIKKQGVVPESMLSSLRTSLRSGNAEQKASAAAMVEQVKTVSPRSLADIDQTTLRQANTISAYVDAGADPATAVRMADEAMQQAKGNEDALDKEYDRLVKEAPTSDWLSSSFDESWWSTPTAPIPVVVEVSAIARNEFLRNGGNLEAARRTALDLAKQRYGGTRVNGSPEVVRNPIEQHYGLPWLSPEQNAKAIKDEAVAEMNTGWTDGKLTADRVRIRPYPSKGVVAADGRPAYAIEVQDSSGSWHVQMDMNPNSPTSGMPAPWAPSLGVAKSARDLEVQGAVAEAKGEVPPGAIVEGTQVYEQPQGKPKRLIGTTASGKFRRLAPGYDKP